MSPKVSVVMPTYNRAHLIAAAIQSILNQTFQDFELVIVDDGSTDGTEAVVRRFNDPRLRYIYQERRGIGAARNRGIRHAEGRYIAFLDSDDVWLPHLLELEVPILDDRPEVGVVYAQARAMDRDGNLMTQIRGTLQKYPDEGLKSALYGDFVCIIASLVRRECFERAGLFDETLMAREDWDMWVRIAKYYRFAHVDQVLAHFRTHDEQRTSAKSGHFAEVCRNTLAVLDKAYSHADLAAEALAIKPLAYRNAYMDMGLRWLRVGALRESARCFWIAIRVSPNPLVTPFRIVWLILFYNVFSKMIWTSRLMSKLVNLKRRRHSTQPP
jgi:glycosyltransferase involved in cell wall biosynthesis